MFASISAQSPPLSHFPASQRVTYLYYLGRYLFANNIFFPAQIALQTAYDQCHAQAQSQRRLILTYLIPCNIILGRFPSKTLLQRPEAEGLAAKFVPLCEVLRKGDVASFRSYLAVDSPDADWFARKGILLHLRNRCELLVWRSLVRKVFILGGFQGHPRAQPQKGPPPFLHLDKLEAVARSLEPQDLGTATSKSTQSALSPYVDRDFVRHSETNPAHGDSDFDDYIRPDGYFDGNGEWVVVNGPDTLPDEPLAEEPQPMDAAYDEFFQGEDMRNREYDEEGVESEEKSSTTMQNLESILASLLTQGFMRGYLTHLKPRFAIPGTRVKGVLPTGFPNVWRTIYPREKQDNHVPGWVKPAPSQFASGAGAAAAGGGRVVNLSGAKPVSALSG